MENVFLTAEQAKKLTKDALVAQNEFEKKYVMNLIKESAERGYSQLEMLYPLCETVQNWLMNLGYEISVNGKEIYWH